MLSQCLISEFVFLNGVVNDCRNIFIVGLFGRVILATDFLFNHVSVPLILIVVPGQLLPWIFNHLFVVWI